MSIKASCDNCGSDENIKRCSLLLEKYEIEVKPKPRYFHTYATGGVVGNFPDIDFSIDLCDNCYNAYKVGIEEASNWLRS